MTTSEPGKEETEVKSSKPKPERSSSKCALKKIINQIIINIIDSLCTGSCWRDLTAAGSAGKELANS